MKFDQLYQKVENKLTSWFETVVAMLPNALVALLVLGTFWGLSIAVGRIVERGLGRLGTHRAARDLVAKLVQVGIVIAGLVVALGVMNLDKALASVLAGAGIIGLALGFAFQDLAGNLISGVGLAVNQDRPFKIGDLVETNEVFGTVRKIHLRTSSIETLDGKMVILPNRQIFQHKVVNFSTTRKRRVDIECGVSYEDDLAKVKSVVKRTMEGLQFRDGDRGAEMYFTGFGDSSINFVARFWIDYQRHSDFLSAQSEAVLALKKALDENDITIPFPIRTLDFGVRGEEPLTTALPPTLGDRPSSTFDGVGRKSEHG